MQTRGLINANRWGNRWDFSPLQGWLECSAWTLLQRPAETWHRLGIAGALDGAAGDTDSAAMTSDPRRHAPAAARNRDPILSVLRRHLPARGLVLEIASGSGEHIVHLAGASDANLAFQPSDPDPAARASIDAWTAALGLSNVRPAIALDAAQQAWPIGQAEAVVCINMIHIAPWSATTGLISGAGRVLSPGGLLYLYGPFLRQGQPTAAGNARFDQDLRRQDPAWGLRALEAVAALALRHGFDAPVIEAMPANNLSLIFRRST